MIGPPKNAGGNANAAHKKLTSAEILISSPAAIKSVAGWQCEAARLFSEYWRTGSQKHLRAFLTHVVAMRAYQARTTQ